MRARPLRSDCPIAASLDIIGDRWTLLVLRDLLLAGRTRFGELAHQESIATNVLSDRLADLVDRGLIERSPDPEDGRRVIYRPLLPAIELLPVIAELVGWGARHTPIDLPPELEPLTDPASRRRIVTDRTRQLTRALRETDPER